MTWSVYIVECSNGALYVGASNDVARRFEQHKAGTGAKSVRAHGGAKALAWSRYVGAKSMALKLESRIKRLSRLNRLKLVRDGTHPIVEQFFEESGNG